MQRRTRGSASLLHATRASFLLANNEICCIQVAMNYPRDFSEVCAISSVVERLLHTQEVAGSNPASRTTVSSAEKTLSDLKWRKIAAVVVIIITKMRLGKKVAGFITIMCRVQDPHNSKSSRRNPIKERAGKSPDTSMESPRFLGIQRKRNGQSSRNFNPHHKYPTRLKKPANRARRHR